MMIALEMVRIARTGLVVAAVLVGAGQAAAKPAVPTPTPAPPPVLREALPLYGQLLSGDWVMARGGGLYFVGQGGVMSLCPDGDYRIKNGSHVLVKRMRIVPPWIDRGFAPQPEPPGKELSAMATGGRRLVISGGRLFFADEGGQRTLCPDGVYALASGGSVRVARGAILNPGNVQGFAP